MSPISVSTQHWIYAKLESWLSGFGDEYALRVAATAAATKGGETP